MSATAMRINGAGDPPRIGVPLPDVQIDILDAERCVVPDGECGEIHIGGAGLARGYLDRPALTAERFVSDPYSGKADGRMYRTGDLGRYRSDGAIEYLGRNDFQVKIRGFRIELGEIEARLSQCEGVGEAVVVARDLGDGQKQLVAYLTAQADPLAIDAIRSDLEQRLPEYMVPSAYVVLEQLPLTANGKLDRKALPSPADEAYVRGAYEAPQGPI